jgi:hypothetical protein
MLLTAWKHAERNRNKKDYLVSLEIRETFLFCLYLGYFSLASVVGLMRVRNAATHLQPNLEWKNQQIKTKNSNRLEALISTF